MITNHSLATSSQTPEPDSLTATARTGCRDLKLFTDITIARAKKEVSILCGLSLVTDVRLA